MLVFGSDITSEQPQINYQIQRALRENDAYLCVANMRSVRIANHSHVFLNYAPGSEVALLAALAKLILEQGLEDSDFIKKFVKNSADVKKFVSGIDPKKVAADAGVDLDLLEEAARKFGAAEKVAVIFGADVTGAAAVTDITAALANVAILSGALNGIGGGVFLVDERPNTQGLLDAGFSPDTLPGGLSYTQKAADVAKVWGCAALPEGGGTQFRSWKGLKRVRSSSCILPGLILWLLILKASAGAKLCRNLSIWSFRTSLSLN